MQLTLHIGPHKTGSTSFQRSCFNSAGLLARRGVIYPTEGPFFEFGQHSKLAALLTRFELDEILAEFDRLQEVYRNNDHLLLSAEDLSLVLAEIEVDRLALLTMALERRFSRINICLVARDERHLLCSGIREYIEGVGFPYHGYNFVSTYVNTFFARMTALRERFSEIRLISFDSVRGDRISNNILNYLFNIDFDISEVATNITSDKSALSILLLSQMRILLFNLLKTKSVYDPKIEEECQVVLDQIKIPSYTAQGVELDFKSWLDNALAEVLDDRAKFGAPTTIFQFSGTDVSW